MRQAKFGTNQTTEMSLHVDLKDTRASLYEFWLKVALEHKKEPYFRRVIGVLFEMIKLCLMVMVLYSAMLDRLWDFLLLFAAHWALMEVWRLLYRPTAITLIVLVMWLGLTPMLFPETSTINLLATFMVILQTLNLGRYTLQLLIWTLLWPNLDWMALPESCDAERKIKDASSRKVFRYDMFVEYLYVNILDHLVHLLYAIVVLLIFFMVQLVNSLLDIIWGLHSWGMLNANLQGDGMCARRTGFKPGSGKLSATPSARILALQGTQDKK